MHSLKFKTSEIQMLPLYKLFYFNNNLSKLGEFLQKSGQAVTVYIIMIFNNGIQKLYSFTNSFVVVAYITSSCNMLNECHFVYYVLVKSYMCKKDLPNLICSNSNNHIANVFNNASLLIPYTCPSGKTVCLVINAQAYIVDMNLEIISALNNYTYHESSQVCVF